MRIESGDDGQLGGVVTSVRTGEHASFARLDEMVRIIERWSGAEGPSPNTKEATP